MAKFKIDYGVTVGLDDEGFGLPKVEQSFEIELSGHPDCEWNAEIIWENIGMECSTVEGWDGCTVSEYTISKIA
jgi:hypothetical protein